jgi:hypothetical protein
MPSELAMKSMVQRPQRAAGLDGEQAAVDPDLVVGAELQLAAKDVGVRAGIGRPPVAEAQARQREVGPVGDVARGADDVGEHTLNHLRGALTARTRRRSGRRYHPAGHVEQAHGESDAVGVPVEDADVGPFADHADQETDQEADQRQRTAIGQVRRRIEEEDGGEIGQPSAAAVFSRSCASFGQEMIGRAWWRSSAGRLISRSKASGSPPWRRT